LKNGGLVALPTETVYGLGANALDEEAVKSIFAAKGRPQDNPLIVHISEFDEIYNLVKEVPESAKALAEKYWPGPMTLILKKSELVPDVVSAGLDTVAVRLPNHEITRAIIKSSGVPIAAPSANLSGSPSPTTAQSVFDDMNGKIPLIVDGGACQIGVESTVISLLGDEPSILRPGGITPEQVCAVLGKVEIDNAVFHKIDNSQKVASPGMKYKHYAPKTKVVIVKGDQEEYLDFLKKCAGSFGALCFEEDAEFVECKYVTFGKENNSLSQSNRLFNALREADSLGVDIVYARYPFEDGMGLAVINRLLRSAAFEVIEVEK
ncbi:MAG: threonylcarbamoyl-AMP synthase, partial [Clostridia bacterium]|nr:threonylcarbamoyl-AMP synthase [Clostridia bacterium]